jgi:hypothetical protein
LQAGKGARSASEIKQRFAEMGVLILGGSPQDVGRMIADETAK